MPAFNEFRLKQQFSIRSFHLLWSFLFADSIILNLRR